MDIDIEHGVILQPNMCDPGQQNDKIEFLHYMKAELISFLLC